jgi:hypothetical protein
MVDKRIIYKDNGEIMVIIPAPNCLKEHSIEEIAEKDVPEGYPYKIIDKSELPDHDFIAAWEIDDNELTDGVGGSITSFDEV